jgi:hypothetical protein
MSRRVSVVRDITGVRFLPDRAPAALVNMSQTGLLVESTVRQRVGSQIALAFEGGFEPDAVTGRVVRCEVAEMRPDGVLQYHTAVEFDFSLEFDDEAEETAAPPAQEVSVRNRW